MDIALKDADGRWDELIGRAERGEEIVITRDGQSVARLGPAEPVEKQVIVRGTPAWRAHIDAITRRAVEEAGPWGGPPGDHSFLYDENGLPK